MLSPVPTVGPSPIVREDVGNPAAVGAVSRPLLDVSQAMAMRPQHMTAAKRVMKRGAGKDILQDRQAAVNSADDAPP